MSESRRPAVSGDHDRWNVELRHITCGKRVSGSRYSKYTCSGSCRTYWSFDTLAAFSDADMALRFFVAVPEDPNVYVLVERTDGEGSKKAYSTFVKLSEVRPTDKRLKPCQ